MKHSLEEAYGMKSLVENLFGRRAWLEVKHSTSVRVWRKYSKRILSAISTSARATVEIADSEWHNELNSIVDLGSARLGHAKDTESVFSALAGTLGLISFHQLGRTPSNATREQVSLRHPSNWKLNQYRSVQYVQNQEQAQTKEAHNKSRHSDAAGAARGA